MTTRTPERPVAAPAEPRQRPGWDGRHLSALFSGIVFTGVGVGYFAAMLLAERISARLGRHILTLGAGFLTVACLLLAVSSGASTSAELLPGLALAGFGIGLVLVPLTAIVLANLDVRHAGAAPGVLSTALQVGGALGIAVLGVVFFGALPAGGFAHAFTVSLLALGVPAVATAALAGLLSRS